MTDAPSPRRTDREPIPDGGSATPADRRTPLDADVGLAVVALAAFVVAAALVGGVSIPFVAIGGLGTIGFEAVALRHRERVRAVWERPAVQLASLAAGLALAAVGASAGATAVPSAGIGAVGVYLTLRLLVAAGVVELPPGR